LTLLLYAAAALAGFTLGCLFALAVRIDKAVREELNRQASAWRSFPESDDVYEPNPYYPWRKQ